ncbi:TniQ family protein [Sutcliffiella horikoshii]|nr:TniQ family protein [Sutcliffiella horikoshii]
MRLCDQNKVHIMDLLKSNNKFYKVYNLSSTHQLDTNPKRVFDIKKISLITGVLERDLLNCSLNSILNVMCDRVLLEEITHSKGSFLNGVYNIKFRYFCPNCLADNLYYKLEWQLKDITICIRHNVLLTSTCSKCGQQQPYTHTNLASGHCFNCDNTLCSKLSTELIYDDSLIRKNVWLSQQYKNFSAIFSSETKSSDISNIYKDILIKFIYLCSNKVDIFKSEDIKFISRDYKYKLLNSLKVTKLESVDISISILFKVLWECKITVENFVSLEIPSSFSKSLLDYLQNLTVCLTPWCQHNNSNKMLFKINNVKSKTHFNLHICICCSVKFGNKRVDKVWEEYGDIIEVGYALIRPLVNAGFSIVDISRKTSISRYKVDKMVSYLTRFNLFNEVINNEFTPNFIDSFDYSYIMKVASTNENETIKKCKKYYKITKRETYYFFYNPIIQKLIYTN